MNENSALGGFVRLCNYDIFRIFAGNIFRWHILCENLLAERQCVIILIFLYHVIYCRQSSYGGINF